MHRIAPLLILVFLLGAVSVPADAQEQTYLPGQSVRVTAQMSLRSEPRYAGEVLATLDTNDTVTIIDGVPVSADALTWYEVSLDGTNLTGWIPDIALGPSAAMLVEALPITEYEDGPASRNPPPACTGLIAYETDYFTAMMLSTYDYPEASDILMQLAMIGTVGGKTIFELDPEQYTALGGFYTGFSEQLRLIEPPPFAEAWHLLQIEVFGVVGEIYTDASDLGMAGASNAHATESADLYVQGMAILTSENPCPDFLPWATPQSPFGPGAMTG